MATVITFTDEEGTASLTAWCTGVGDRLNAYVPFKTPIGQARTLLATGARRFWRYRTDYGTALELRLLPVSSLPLVTRLIAHLQNGGEVSIATGDSAAHTYPTVGLAPESEPELRLADPKLKRYTLALRVVNLADTPAPILVAY